jgi:hypothetical protein
MVALSFSSLTTAALLDGIRCETRRGWLGCNERERGSYLISREAAALFFSPLFFSLSLLRAPAAPGPIDDSAHNVAPPPRILLGQRRRRCSHNNIQFSFFSTNLTCSATRWIVKTLSVGIQLFRGGQEILERHRKFNGDWIKSYTGGSASKKKNTNPWAFFLFLFAIYITSSGGNGFDWNCSSIRNFWTF